MKLLNFKGFAAAVVMLEAIVLAKIHTGSARHEKTVDQTNNKEFSVLGATEDNAACSTYTCVFSDL